MPHSFGIRAVITMAMMILLLSAVPLSEASSSDGDLTDLALEHYRPATASDLQLMISTIGVRDPSVNYNILVGGMGTGLAPPTMQEWEMSLGTILLDQGTDQYDVPAASSLDLSTDPYFPQVRSQGSEGSCAAFALTYYNYGYIEARDQGWDQAKTGNNSHLLSPSWTYNKVNGVTHEGSSFQENARIIKQLGAAAWAAYPYMASDDEDLGNEAAWRSAPAHRISSYVSVYNPSSSTVVDLIKEQLGLHRPVNFAINAYQYQNAFEDGNYILSAAEYSSTSYNHGQTIVGYDDEITDDGDEGAFKVVNSWGQSFGQGGYYFVTYEAIKEMLGYPLVYLIDLEDYQPALLATWEFSTPPSVDATLEVGAGDSSSPSDKVSTYFRTGSTNSMCTFLAMDVSALYDDYQAGAHNFYLKVGSATTGGTVSSFRMEMYATSYIPGSPTSIIAESTEVPKNVPGVVNAGPADEDLTPPSSKIEALPQYQILSSFTVQCTSSDAGGSGVAHWELFYRYNAQGSYLKYCPTSNPSGEWGSGSITFDIAQASGQGAYQFYSVAVDNTGNREPVPSSPDTSTTVDLTAPVSSMNLSGTAGEEGWYVSQVSVSLSATDQWSGVQSIMYRLNGGSWTTYSSVLSLGQGQHLLEYQAVDRAGNWEGIRSASIKVDTMAPTVQAQVNGTVSNGWYSSAVTVTLQVTDGMDPSCQVRYRLNGGTWLSYAGGITLSAEGQHILEYEAWDQAGNLAQGSLTISIDSTAPQSQHVLQGTLGQNGWYTSTVSVSLSATDQYSGVQSIMYRLNGGSWTTYSSVLSLGQGQHSLDYRAADHAGNWEEIRSATIKVDTKAPQVHVQVDGTTHNGWYTSPVTVTLQVEDAMDPDCQARYRLDGGTWLQYEDSTIVSADGQHLLEYEAWDQAGNLAQGSIDIGIDTTAPQSQRVLQGTLGQNDWYVSTVSVSLSATDQCSGVASIYYRMNGGPWTVYEAPLQLSLGGVHLLEHYAMDEAGIAEGVRSIIIKVDVTAPTVQVQMDGTPCNGWYSSSVMVMLQVTDDVDQECDVRYRLDNGNWTSYSEAVPVQGEGHHLLEYEARDQAGNLAQGSIDIGIDTTVPQSQHVLDGELGEEGRYVSAVNVTLSGADQGSGLAGIYYRLDGGAWELYTTVLQLSQDGIFLLEHYAVDVAGNQGTLSQVQVLIDSQGPTVEMTTDRQPSAYDWFDGAVTITLTALDHFDPNCEIWYRLNQGSWEHYSTQLVLGQEGAYDLECYATDPAGNTGEIVSREFKMDLTDPECSVELTGDEGLNGYFVSEVSVSLVPSDQCSGISTTKYRLDGGDWMTYSGTFPVSQQGTSTLEFYATDRAGNEMTLRNVIINIDTTPPQVLFRTDVEPTNGWFDSPVQVELYIDNEELQCVVHYRYNGGPWELYDGPITIDQEGMGALEWYGVDLAGNQGALASVQLQLDLSPPQCSPTLQGIEGTNGFFISSVWIALHTEDLGSGAQSTFYRLNEGDYVLYEEEVQLCVEGEHLLEFYAVDMAGNTGNVGSSEIMIDLTPPELTIEVLKEPLEDGSYLNLATLRLTAMDEGSDVLLFRYDLDGSGWIDAQGDVLVEGEGAHIITLHALDHAGNNASRQLSIEISMPSEPPLAVQGLTAVVTEEGILLTWSPSSTGLEAEYLIYRSNDGQEALIANVMGTTYLDQEVMPGEEYGYRVVPVNTVGEGPSAQVVGLALPDDVDGIPYLPLLVLGMMVIALGLFIMRRR